VPKPVLPLGSICHKCRVLLTQQELDSFSVGVSKGVKRKWGPCRCGHKQSSSVNPTDFAVMLSLLSVFERFCVLISVANFAAAKKDIALQLKDAAKKAVKLQLAADAVEMEDGPLDDEPEEELEEFES
jgi:hypothetical protein